MFQVHGVWFVGEPRPRRPQEAQEEEPAPAAAQGRAHHVRVHRVRQQDHLQQGAGRPGVQVSCDWSAAGELSCDWLLQGHVRGHEEGGGGGGGRGGRPGGRHRGPVRGLREGGHDPFPAAM